MSRPRDGVSKAITLISSNGIGPLVTSAVEQVMEAMYASVYFDRYQVRGDMKNASPEVIESIRKNKVCLKRGFFSAVGDAFGVPVAVARAGGPAGGVSLETTVFGGR
ncbi:hypothetical protein LOK49_LG02G01217 [Camellia lanceoleosa]|uniref:Uncharacterized protein n=1 Tax=Camellia lanceoleosa TaxID=1840588 RepID=A0ACC0IX48_9ERIC|nr:hypothetical protein LOK49_LG02G01217 [Camellia lanceoleosa]